MRWTPNDWFGERFDLTMGVEVEMVVFDGQRNELNQRHERLDGLFRKLPDNIWKDYYPYQLEIRSSPHDSPKKVVEQMLELYKMADEAFQKENLFIIPVPWTGGMPGEQSYCGMHTHVRYLNEERNKKFYELAWGAYPFILAIADHTKNAEEGTFSTSARMKNSHHIKVPHLEPKTFNNGQGQNRWTDITANSLSSGDGGEDPRHRLKKITTLETRIFDTPTLRSHLQFITDAVYHVYSRIKADAPTGKNPQEFYEKCVMSRALAIEQRYGYNKILRESNANVCRDLGEIFGFNVPDETQFEFREAFTRLNMIDRKLLMRQYAWPHNY